MRGPSYGPRVTGSGSQIRTRNVRIRNESKNADSEGSKRHGARGRGSVSQCPGLRNQCRVFEFHIPVTHVHFA